MSNIVWKRISLQARSAQTLVGIKDNDCGVFKNIFFWCVVFFLTLYPRRIKNSSSHKANGFLEKIQAVLTLLS